MKKLKPAGLSAGDLIRLRRPRAFGIAPISSSPDPVGKFPGKMHIPKHEASVAAILIRNEARKSRIRSVIPGVALTLLILGCGVALVFAGFFTHCFLLSGAGAGTVAICTAALLGAYADNR